ncbi:MAG TPA: MFS transporter [Anaerolineae bacterium]|nr:MFS transporter [Anaerolineae bacterium]HQK14688.1 MFS transporter [Anaerolineae bacterium]
MLPSNYRRNFRCLVTDFAAFGIAMAFFSPSTVIPSFLTELGASNATIGLMSTLQRACWLLPQLIIARYMANKPYKKPAILWAAGSGRSLLLFLAGLVWATGARPPKLITVLVAILVSAFWIGDGLSSLSWFDLFSKVIPANRRGRLISTGQVLSGLFSFLAGFAVEWILSDRGLPYPSNFALLFLIAFGLLAVSFIAISLIIEPPGVTEGATPSWREYLPQLWRILKTDHTFRNYTIARQLFNLSNLAGPFYMTYALDVLALPAHVAGRYTSIGVVGGILAALFFGWINEKRGTKSTLLYSIGVTALIPALALAVPGLFGGSGLGWAYGLVFFASNASMSSFMPGWTAYVLELAPEAERPAYVGLNNTINGISTLFSTLGGLILQWTGNNYGLLFVITIFATLSALPLSLRLRDPREQAAL